MVDALGCDDTERAQVGADGVALKAQLRCDGKLGLLAHQKIPCPVPHQRRLLILGLDRRRAGGTPLA